GTWQEKVARGRWSVVSERSIIVSDGQKDAVVPAAISAKAEEVVGRLDAELLASKALLLRVHGRLESGVSSQLEIALLRVWLSQTSASEDDGEALLQRLLTNRPRDDRAIVNPAAGPPVTSYADFSEAHVPYDSGHFLILSSSTAQARP